MAAVFPSRGGFRSSVAYTPEAGCRSKSWRKKKNPPEKDGRRCGSPIVMKFPVRDLVMGQVKILQRGEELKVTRKELSLVNAGDSGAEILKPQNEDVVKSSTELIGPEPEKEVPRRLKEGRLVVGLYAGPSCHASPSPKSLPLPGFLKKR